MAKKLVKCLLILFICLIAVEGIYTVLQILNARKEVASFPKKEIDISDVAGRALSFTDVMELTENSLYVYEKCVEFATAVAEGDITDTILVINLEDMLGKLVYSPEELGVKEVTEENRIDLANGILNYGTSVFFEPMLNEHPYIFYWFDNTVGMNRIDYKDNIRIEDGNLVLPSEIRYQFSVSTDYQLNGNVYEVNPAKVEAAKVARENALSIVDAAKDMSDLDKLNYYCDKICDLTDYDHELNKVEIEEGMYGDPWQMIYVFDGDDQTKVLCEGFSKAFKFLCDETEFQDEIYAYIARGYKNGGKHMWNIVHMGDGKYYMADLTTCNNVPISGVRMCFLMEPDEGSWQEGYVYKAREYDTEDGVISVPEITYDYYDRVKELWQNTILDLSEEKIQ